MSDDTRILALEAAEAFNAARYAIGAVDGYDYNSGYEFGLREAEIIIRKLTPTSKEGE